MNMTRRHAAEALLAAAAAGFCPAQAWAAVPEASSPALAAGAAPRPEEALLQGAQDGFDHMTVPVMLNGAGPFPFMVDTGANISCVAGRVAEALNLPIKASRPVHTAAGVRSQPMAQIAELKVGAQVRRDMAALALAIDDPRLGGVLAVDWLQKQRLTLNFAGNSLEFSPSRHEYGRPGRVVVPARRRHGQLTIVEAELGDRPISALIDSGSEMTLCNAALRRLVDRSGASQTHSQPVQLVSILGEAFSGDLIHLPFLRIGGLQLGDVPVVQSDSHAFRIWGVADTPAILLGMDLLRQFRAVSLDFGRSQVRFDLASA